MLTKEEVQHIARLARLKLSDEEAERLQTNFGTTLEFVGKLNEVDTKGVEIQARGTEIENVVRVDGSSGDADARILSLLQERLEQAPLREGDHIKVKAVFE